MIISVSCRAQQTNNWKELIITSPHLDSKIVYKISKQLACLQGLHFSGYYAPASCLLLKYDSTKIIDPNIISVLIHHLNYKMKVEMLKGTSIYDVVDGKIDPKIERIK